MKNCKLGTKIFAGFLSVIFIFCAVVAYQLFSISGLHDYQEEGADRAKDALKVNQVLSRVGEVYPVIADAVINRNYDETIKDFEQLKKQARTDIKLVHDLVDTEAERTLAKDFENSYNSYLKLFERDLKPILAKGESISKRMKDSIGIMQIAMRVQGVYTVMADAVINRNLSETRADWAKIKEPVEKDISAVHSLSDTDAEKDLARKFENSYRRYLNIFENRLLPLLKGSGENNTKRVRKLDGELDKVRTTVLDTLESISKSLEDETHDVIDDEKKIRDIDEKIDTVRDKVYEPLSKIVKSLEGEMDEAEEKFDDVSAAAFFIGSVVSLVGVIAGFLIAFLLTRGICGPLDRIISGLDANSDQVASASDQVSSSSQSLAEGASEQAASIEETSSSLEEISSMTNKNAENSNEADKLMKVANKVVGDANDSMEDLTKSMEEINKASEETSKIIKTIDEIAFQTNLLALNAAVEAARAGEAGAGFAVVADEVRNLAMRAADAAKDTSDLIEGTVRRVSDGSELVTKTNDSFNEVAESTAKVGQFIGEIAMASNEQAQGIEQINKGVTEMDRIVQQTAAIAEESASASEEMNAQASQMKNMVNELNTLVSGAGNVNNMVVMNGAASSRDNNKSLKPVNEIKNRAHTGDSREVKPEQIIPLDDDFQDF